MESRLIFHWEGLPIGKPRMNRGDRWRDPPRKAVLKWRTFKSSFLAAAMEQGFRPAQMKLKAISVLAIFPIPSSWSFDKRKANLGQLHRSKPDLSNIVKAVEDALVDNDETIAVYGTCAKLWGPSCGITVTVDWEPYET